MATVKEIHEIKSLIENSTNKKDNGESFVLQALVNYVEKVFYLSVIKATEKNEGIQIIAESNNYKGMYFLFKSNCIKSEKNHFRNHTLTLETVEQKGFVAKIKKVYSLANWKTSENKNDFYFRSPMKDILVGNVSMVEKAYAVEQLKKKLSGNIDYEYGERVEGDIDSFYIEGKDFLINSGFSTINVLLKGKMKRINIEFEKRSKISLIFEMKKLAEFLIAYDKNELKLDCHNISNLYDGVTALVGNQIFDTSLLRKPGLENLQELFCPFVINGVSNETYGKNLEVSINYDLSKKVFVIKLNYLLEDSIIELNTVEEVLSTLETLISLLN